MYFERIYDTGLAQASYLVGCQATGNAVVIDPKRDVDTYIQIAERENLRITHVAETHIHADFLSGSRELAQLTGAKMYLSDEGGPEWQYEFDHEGLRHGDVFEVGNLKFEVLHTPGHTPEHISFLLTDTPAGAEPVMIFTGDFVFVGDVGRPDLLEKAAGYKGTMEVGARQMYASLQRFKALPDFVQVWPAHGAGSACGKALGSVPSSTVGYEKSVAWAFRHEAEDAFVEALLHGQPEPPKYFAMMKKLNKVGRPLMTEIRRPKLLGVGDIDAAMADGMKIIDTRPRAEFAKAHIPGSIHIAAGVDLSAWCGWLLEYDKPFVVIAGDADVDEAVRVFARIGLDQIHGYAPSIDDWITKGRPTAGVKQMSAAELERSIDDVTLVDVRGLAEFDEGYIASARHIHLGYLEDRLSELPKDGTLVMQCRSGNRSTIAASILQRHGFDNVVNLTPGIVGWIDAGFAVVTAEVVGS